MERDHGTFYGADGSGWDHHVVPGAFLVAAAVDAYQTHLCGSAAYLSLYVPEQDQTNA
jgi:hypothetical protein